MYSTGGIYIFSLICKRLRLYLHKVRGKRGLNMFFGLLLCTRIMDLGILRFPREGSQSVVLFSSYRKKIRNGWLRNLKRFYIDGNLRIEGYFSTWRSIVPVLLEFFKIFSIIIISNSNNSKLIYVSFQLQILPNENLPRLPSQKITITTIG